MTAKPTGIRHLQPCPFCGAVGYDLVMCLMANSEGNNGYAVKCDRCGAEGPKQPGMNTARRDWNLRKAGKPAKAAEAL